MAKKKRRKARFTLPMAIVAPIAASFFTQGKTGWGGSPYDELKAGNYKNAMNHLLAGWVGIDTTGHFDPFVSMNYTKMTIIGALVHFAASKLGINRALGRAKVPILRI